MKTTSIILIFTLLGFGCTNSISEKTQNSKIEELQALNDSLQSIVNGNKPDRQQQIITSLTFQKNDAEQAMNFYVSLFENSEIIDVKRWGKEGLGKEGTIMQAVFELNGQKFMCSDSPPIHNWDFTPAVSNYIECRDESELERLFSRLSESGTVAMPLDNYGFSQRFGWVIDRYGVSWQLNLQ